MYGLLKGRVTLKTRFAISTFSVCGFVRCLCKFDLKETNSTVTKLIVSFRALSASPNRRKLSDCIYVHSSDELNESIEIEMFRLFFET